MACSNCCPRLKSIFNIKARPTKVKATDTPRKPVCVDTNNTKDCDNLDKIELTEAKNNHTKSFGKLMSDIRIWSQWLMYNLGGEQLKKLKANDFALCTANWYPTAEWEEYKIITLFFVWLFAWDDLFESLILDSTRGTELANEYLSETIVFVRSCLGVGESLQELPKNPIINSFQVISKAIMKVYTDDQRQTLLEGLEKYFQGVNEEQRIIRSDELPSLDVFWKMRIGASGVEPTLAFNEYALKQHLPSHIMKSDPIKVIWKECTEIIIIVNDLISFRKEKVSGDVLNLITVTHSADGGVEIQEAFNKVFQLLTQSVNKMNTATKEALEIYKGSEVEQEVKNFVELVLMQCAGNLDWSLKTRRYGISPYIKEDGSIEIDL
ncbi:hypothetical protein CROQUDRAFT_110334 [Cronartium quercuum f. sp. fusiforme G11]|uniref:Terpene synthase n=1 Tax=Cronartium quercuum f. sp. fusiforme G11 TaxID=708437 RepID=A0A9P6NDJ2_9BASI|nr:hypothetical protein CROQUDRAFT_110334 [Cronartium quercuum f. sp. fusiforme G11]